MPGASSPHRTCDFPGHLRSAPLWPPGLLPPGRCVSGLASAPLPTTSSARPHPSLPHLGERGLTRHPSPRPRRLLGARTGLASGTGVTPYCAPQLPCNLQLRAFSFWQTFLAIASSLPMTASRAAGPPPDFKPRPVAEQPVIGSPSRRSSRSPAPSLQLRGHKRPGLTSARALGTSGARPDSLAPPVAYSPRGAPLQVGATPRPIQVQFDFKCASTPECSQPATLQEPDFLIGLRLLPFALSGSAPGN